MSTVALELASLMVIGFGAVAGVRVGVLDVLTQVGRTMLPIAALAVRITGGVLLRALPFVALGALAVSGLLTEVVVVHDRDLMRVGGVNLAIADATYEQLAEVDVGSWFGPAFADQRMPTLAQALALCRDRVGVVIELKYFGRDERLEERVIEVVAALEELNPAERLAVNVALWVGIVPRAPTQDTNDLQGGAADRPAGE